MTRHSHAVDDFFFIRSPLLPFSTFTSWGADLTARIEMSDEALAESLERDACILRERLMEIVRSPRVREAIFISSPALHAALDVWTAKPESEQGRRAELAVTKYFARMSGRSTPFGLMSGCSVGYIGSSTVIRLEGVEAYRRKTRFDHDYIFRLSAALEADAALRAELRYTPNSSLYRVGQSWRYVEASDHDGRREYRIASVVATEYIDRVVAAAQSGVGIEELSDLLAREFDATPAEATDFVNDLIDQQMLVSDLTPRLSGGPAVGDLLARLRSARRTEYSEALSDACEAIEALDREGVGTSISRYEDASAALQRFPVEPEPSRLFQVDMFKPATVATLDRLTAAELIDAASVVIHFSRPASHELKEFRDRFVARFGQRTVPLTLALDSEAGIGYPIGRNDDLPSSLLDHIAVPPHVSASRQPHPAEQVVIRKWTEALMSRADEIVIEESDVPSTTARLPPLTGLVAAIVAPERRTTYSAILHSVLGQSAASLIGRFCHADDSLTELVSKHLRREEDATPDVIFAEVVHLPEQRVANVLSRPLLRRHEIPYMARSAARAEDQIMVSDLDISVDADGTIVLRSRSRGRRVVPRMANAYNFRLPGNLPIFRFLGALEEEITGKIWSWSWGPLESAPYLPRVRYRTIVLSPSVWNLDERQVHAITRGTRVMRFREIQRLRAELRLPRHLYVADRDYTLPVDLDNILSIDAASSLLRGRRDAMLLEMIPASELSPVAGPEGRFIHEVVIPYHAARPTVQEVPRRDVANAERSFVPGSDWLYAKIYTGTAAADRLLTETIAPLVADLVHRGMVKKWFFLRYYDPEFHLRVRFRGEGSFSGDVLPALSAALAAHLESGEVHRVEIDTYDREVERYGGSAGIELCESLFHADSTAVLRLIEISRASAPPDRWRIAVAGVDEIFSDFRLAVPVRHRLTEHLFSAAAAELALDRAGRARVAALFRRERRNLVELRQRRGDSSSEIGLAMDVLRERSAAFEPFIEDLTRIPDLAPPIHDIAASIAHMHVNRLLPSSQRTHEMAIYFFLHKLYDEELARSAAPVGPA